MLDKIYYKHTGRKGNMKEVALRELIKKDPSKPLWHAVRGMLAKNKLRDPRMQRLKMFV
jgi:large subunit ribosomal protein L13